MGIPSESFGLYNIITMATSAASQNLTKLLYLPTQPICPSGAIAGPTDDLISLSLVPGLVFIGQTRQEFTLHFLQSCIMLFCLAVS